MLWLGDERWAHTLNIPFIRRWEGAFRHHSEIVAATAAQIRAPPHQRGEVFRISVGRKRKSVSLEVAEHIPPWLLQLVAFNRCRE